MDDMLWMAGLVGLAGVGAVAFIGLGTDTPDDDEEPEPENTVVHNDEDGILDQIKDHGTAGSLLQDGAPVAFSSQPTLPTGSGWGDDVLNDIMSEIAAEGDTSEAETHPSDAHTAESAEEQPPEDAGAVPSVDQALSDWIADRGGPDVLDYEAHADSLMLVWDDSDARASEPAVTVAPDADDPDVMQVSMDGEAVAHIHGDASLTASDVTLLPLSSAVEVGLEAV